MLECESTSTHFISLCLIFVIACEEFASLCAVLFPGGYGHNPIKMSLNNIFAGNQIVNNGGHDGGQVNIHHGATTGETLALSSYSNCAYIHIHIHIHIHIYAFTRHIHIYTSKRHAYEHIYMHKTHILCTAPSRPPSSRFAPITTPHHHQLHP